MKTRLAAILAILLLGLAAATSAAAGDDSTPSGGQATAGEASWELAAESTRPVGSGQLGVIQAKLVGTQEGQALGEIQALLRFRGQSPASGTSRDALVVTDSTGTAQAEEFFKVADEYLVTAWVDGHQVASPVRVRIAQATATPQPSPSSTSTPNPATTSRVAATESAQPTETPEPETSSEPDTQLTPASADEPLALAVDQVPTEDQQSPTPTPSPNDVTDPPTPPLPVECQIEGCTAPSFEAGGEALPGLFGWAFAIATLGCAILCTIGRCRT
jgi:hypothetical protein